ncbi:hypothetical protein RAH41_08180 [Gottfriedia acidiceleris]|uniref:hypothetical protein n=1 Tax=Gottfriedia acidiceleris TaxID=371036 RepID=UPI002F26C935
MALFAKNKPTKRVEFEGGWVELQFLSKGVKDEIASRLAPLHSELKNIENATEEDVPEGVFDVLGQINQIEYYKVAHAIKAWSEEEEITEENVKALDSEVFEKISKSINDMNELSQGDKKN